MSVDFLRFHQYAHLRIDPLILAKTRLQSRSSSEKRQYRSTTDCLQKIYKRYGIQGLYNGLSSKELVDAPAAV